MSDNRDHSRLKGAFIIIGSSYCGSTLLNAMLNAHPSICGGGELHWLLEGGRESHCAICGTSCRFWTEAARTSVTPANLYETTAQVFGKPFVVDASKMPVWFAEYLPQVATPKVHIVLPKHPFRAVASFVEKARRFEYMAKYADIPTTLSHLRYIYKYGLEQLPVDHILRYEDLVADPVKSLGLLLRHHNLQFDSAMLDWETADQHFIGGNIGPRTQINRRQKPVGDFLAAKYARSGVFLDDTYRQILTEAELDVIRTNPDGRYLLENFGYSPEF